MAEILVVRDAPMEGAQIALLLEFEGHRCNLATSLQEAVTLLREESYDLVIADSILGDSGSVEVARILRGISPRLVMLVPSESAKSSHGVEETLTLPCSPDYFFQRIKGLVRKSVRPARTLRKIRRIPPGVSAKAAQRRQSKSA